MSNQIYYGIQFRQLSLAQFNQIKALHLQKKIHSLQLNHKIMYKSITSLINYLTHITSLSLVSNKFNQNTVLPINKLTKLKQLNLKNNKLTNKGVENLSSLQNLQYLNLQNTNITGDILKHISQKYIKLKELYLGYNKLGGNVENFVKLNDIQNLQVLNLCESQINDQIVFQLNKLINLKSLNLRNNLITNESIPVIVKMEKICKLYLGFNRIKDEGVKLIANFCKNLEQLQLCYNVLTDISGVQIGQNLLKLVKLDLKSNKIGNNGFNQIIKNLKYLEYLCLNDNMIGDVSQLVKLNDQQINLKHLYIQFNRLSKKDTEPLLKKLHPLKIEVAV